MRIRLLRNVRMDGANSVELLAGNVVNTTPEIADKWIKQGMAMEDKSMDGGSRRTDEVMPLETTDTVGDMVKPTPKPKLITRPPVRRKKRTRR